MQALERILSVLHALAAGPRQGMRLTDIVSQSGLDRATASRLLDALLERRLVSRDEAGKRFRLGAELTYLGLAAERNFDIGRCVHGPVSRLASKTGDCCYLTLRSGNYAVCYAKVTGNYPIQASVVEVGARRPLGVGGTSLALLAWLPDEEITGILEENSPALHNYPGYSNERLLREIGEARTRGYALVKSYLTEDVQTLAAPIRDPWGRCIAGISIATISLRLANGREEFVANAVLGAAREVEEALRLGRDPR